MRSRPIWLAALTVAGLAMVVTAGCGSKASGSSNLSGSIRIDGSSTVGPLTEAALIKFQLASGLEGQ